MIWQSLPISFILFASTSHGPSVEPSDTHAASNRSSFSLAPDGFRKYRSKEAIVKSNAPPKAAKALGKRIDYYCKLFQEFYDELGLEKKNDNVLKIRLFDSYDDFDEYYRRGGAGLGSTPLAYFSSSLNSIVMYRDEKDVALRAVVFHECSHQFLNRYTYDAPKWLNEGMAEYFEGWTVDPGVSSDRRPHLYDLSLVKEGLASGQYLEPKQLVEMSAVTFNAFSESYPHLNSYLHYATSWSLVYHCLHSDYEKDKALLVNYLEDLTKKGSSAEFEVEDWEAFTERWKHTVTTFNPKPDSAKEHFLLGAGARVNREYRKAIQHYGKALEMDPELPGARFWVGFCHKRTGNYKKAVEVLEEVLETDPEDARAAYNLARIYLGIDKENADADVEKALACALRASEIANEKSPSYLLLLARCYQANDEASKARKTAKRILKVVDKDEKGRWEPLVEAILKKK